MSCVMAVTPMPYSRDKGLRARRPDGIAAAANGGECSRQTALILKTFLPWEFPTPVLTPVAKKKIAEHRPPPPL